jgi:hypothetical protein
MCTMVCGCPDYDRLLPIYCRWACAFCSRLQGHSLLFPGCLVCCSPGRQGEENLAQEVWREREEEANSVRGLGGEGCLLMSQGGMLEGGLTWSEMCCRAILRLRTRGLIDQAKLHFIR